MDIQTKRRGRPAKQIPSTEELRQVYIIENHSLVDTAKRFDISPRTMTRWLQKAGLRKIARPE